MKFTKYIIFIFIIPIYCQFGKNIVQYKSFEWNYIQSKHFDIYFYNNDSLQNNHSNKLNSNAEFVANESMKAYDIISNAIGWKLKNRIPIIVYNSHNDFQQTNIIDMYMPEGVGGVTELYKNRVVIPYDGNYKQFKNVIHHELVHAFINDYIYKGSITNMQNEDVVLIPLWMNEGLAEFLASPWDTESDMWIRDLVINGEQLPKLNELNGFLAYRGGQSIWKFIIEELDTAYNNKKTEAPTIIASIFSSIASSSDLNSALEKSLDINLEDLELAWHKYLKAEYWPDINNREYINDISEPMLNYKKINSTYDIGPSISPDGKKLAYYSNQDGLMSVCIISSDCQECNSKSINKILKGGMSIDFEELHILKPGISWSKNNEKIILSSASKGEDVLFVIDVNTKEKNKFEFGSYSLSSISQPIWNPISDNIIAFIGSNNTQSDIYMYDLQSNKLTQLTNDIFTDQEISWTSDGQNILFSSDRGIAGNNYWSNQYDLYSFNLSSNSITQLTNSRHNEHHPNSIYSDSLIVYISDENGINNIYMRGYDNNSNVMITNVFTGITHITGQNNNIYFSSLNNKKFQISKLDTSLIEFNRAITDSNVIDAQWLANQANYDFKLLNHRLDQKQDNYRNYIFDKTAITSNILNKEPDIVATEIKDSTGNYIIRQYKTKFSLDVGQLSVGVGLNNSNNNYSQNGLGIFQFSDILGDHKIYLGTELDVNFKRSDYALVYRYLPKLIDWTFLFSHDGITVINGPNQEDSMLQDRTLYQNIVFGIDANRPFSRFNRFEFNINHYLMLVHDETVSSGSYGGIESSKQEYVGNLTTLSGRYVWDNTRWFYTYPINGSRFYFKYKTAPTSSYDINLVSFDGRLYKPLFNGVSLLFRNFLAHTWGENRQSVYLGAEPSFYSSNPNSSYFYQQQFENENHENLLTLFNFTENVTPIRGVPFMYKYGDNVALLNLELRAPFLLYYFPAIKWVGQINGIIFMDLGVAWDNQSSFPDITKESNWVAREDDTSQNYGWVMSYGWGPRFILLGLPFKLNYAWQYNPITKQKSNRRYEITIGIDL